MGLPQANDIFGLKVGATQGEAGTGTNYSVTWAEMLSAIDSQLVTTKGYQTAAQVTSAITAAIAGKADVATTAAGYGITDVYTKTEVDSAIANTIDSAPETLNTLNELAAALGDDPNFATTISTLIGTKAPLASPLFTGELSINATTFDETDISNWNTAHGWGNHASAGYAAGSHTHAISDVTGLQDALDNAGEVPIDSPNFTGTPTAPTAAFGTDTTQIATTAFVEAAVSALPGGGATSLNGLSDVILTSPTEGQFLRRNGASEFINAFLIESDIPDLSAAKVTSGTFADARISESSVTQHQSALTITKSQISDRANWDTAYGWGDHSVAGYATTGYVDTSISNLVNAAPGLLDTLDEIAAALGDDPNFATTMTTQLATKLNASAYTAADVLAKILTVDGAGSGLDSDLLDGENGAYYLAWANITGAPNFAATYAPISHSHAISDVTNLQSSLDAKAALADPDFTGTPTAPTAAVGTSNTELATTAFVKAEIAEELHTDAPKTSNFTAVANSKVYLINTAGGTFTMTLPASPAVGDVVGFVDTGGALSSNKLIIGRNGELLGGIAEDADVIRDRTYAFFRFVGGSEGWRVTLA